MEIQSPPFWILPFRDRQVGVSDHAIRGLVVFDSKGQRNLPEGRIRIYSAREHKLLVLFENPAKSHLRIPSTARKAWLAVYSYKAFLNPALKRPSPSTFAPEPIDYEFSVEDNFSSVNDSEMDLIYQELREDQDSWARSEEEGWYYSDYEGNEQ